MKFNFSLKGRKEANSRPVFATRVPDPQWDLYRSLVGLFPNGAFYGQPAERIEAVRALIGANEIAYLSKMAIYFREKLQMRSLSFVLTAELAALHGDAEWAGVLAVRVIRDPAELPEWLGYYAQARKNGNGKTLRLPGRLRKSLGSLLNLLNEYWFSRLSRAEQEKMKAALVLIHPAAVSKAQKSVFDKILHDRIAARSSWAAELAGLQQQSYDSADLRSSMLRDKWKEGISSFRIGYPALLESLRPILAAGVSGKVLKLAGEYLGNAAAVTRSKTSPLSLLAAYRKLKGRSEGGVSLMLDALEQAAWHSAHAIAGVTAQDRLVIAMDVSNSMKQPIREGSCIQRYDVGPLMAHLLKTRTRSLQAGIIGNNWKPVELTAQGILNNVDPFHRREGEAGYAINAHLVIQDLLKKRQVVDKVMIFTDCSLWESRPFHQSADADLVRVWREYREIAPQATLCLFDLAGYGHQPVENPEEGVYLIAGWHDGALAAIKAMSNRDEVLETIGGIAL